MEHYKKYKRMYIVDTTDEFKGIKCQKMTSKMVY